MLPNEEILKIEHWIIQEEKVSILLVLKKTEHQSKKLEFMIQKI